MVLDPSSLIMTSTCGLIEVRALAVEPVLMFFFSPACGLPRDPIPFLRGRCSTMDLGAIERSAPTYFESFDMQNTRSDPRVTF